MLSLVIESIMECVCEKNFEFLKIKSWRIVFITHILFVHLFRKKGRRYFTEFPVFELKKVEIF